MDRGPMDTPRPVEKNEINHLRIKNKVKDMTLWWLTSHILTDAHDIHFHDTVFKEMRLQGAISTDSNVIFNVHEIKFSNIRRLQIDSCSYLSPK